MKFLYCHIRLRQLWWGVTVFLLLLCNAPRAHALTVISPVLEMEADAGSSQRGIIKLYNETNSNQVITSSIESFNHQDESGNPIFSAVAASADVTTWFRLEADALILRPKQVAIIPFTLTVPKAATPGGYYAVIFWQPDVQTGMGPTAVGIKEKVGTVVLIQVRGAVMERAKLSEFSLKQSGTYLFTLPLNFVVRFANDGNIHLKPSGTITLATWGRTVTLPVNREQYVVLPGSERRFEIVWGQSPRSSSLWQQLWPNLVAELQYLPFGSYTATLDMSYGSSNQTLTSEVHFWFIPVRVITVGIITLVLLAIFLFINRRVNRLKRKALSLKKNEGESTHT